VRAAHIGLTPDNKAENVAALWAQGG